MESAFILSWYYSYYYFWFFDYSTYVIYAHSVNSKKIFHKIIIYKYACNVDYDYVLTGDAFRDI